MNLETLAESRQWYLEQYVMSEYKLWSQAKSYMLILTLLDDDLDWLLNSK